MKNLRKWTAFALAAALFVTPALAAEGQVSASLNYSNIKITVDGQEIIPTDETGRSTEPFSIDGTVYLPIRAVSEALGYDVKWDAETNTVQISTGAVVEGDVVTWSNDNVKITDASFDKYFPGTTALEGVKKLLAEGKVCVNGIKVPATEDEVVVYQVNGVDSLYKTETGWGYNVHKTTSANNLSFADARLGFFETITTVRGHTTELTLDPETKEVIGINTNSLDVVRVADIIVYNESTTIKRGDFELETARVRPDVEPIVFNTANFDQSVQIGDIAVYWYGPNGWNLKRAVPVEGTLSKVDGKFVINGADTRVESNVSRYNLINSSRPTQFYTAYTQLGLESIPVVTWCTDTGHPIGFTTGSRAKEALALAIANAKAAKEGVTVSADGAGVQGKWTTQEAMDAFDAAIAAAEAVYNDNLAANIEKDMAIYQLSLAYGEGGNKPSGFIGSLGGVEAEPETGTETPSEQPTDPVDENMITWDNDNVKITDASFDRYFPGATALEGVKKLLAEGKVYVNGIQVPASEDATSDYQVNGVSSLYKTETGWGYNVHKTTSANNLSFDDARLGFFETITSVRGHKTSITLDDAGNPERIDAQSYEVFRIAYFEDHGGQVDKIERGDFELETNRVRPDVESITAVASDRFGRDIEIGDVVVYYYGPDGWVMEKAMAKAGTVTKVDGNFVVNQGKEDEYTHVESNVSRYNLINCNRPTQFYDSYVRLGLTDQAVVTWCTPNGFPIGFTLGGRTESKATLAKAIANAKAAKEGVAVSASYGADVPAGAKWVTQEAMDAFDAAIAAAEAVCNNNAAELYQYDMAMYELANALGQGGNKPSGFVGAQGEGTGA